MFRKRRKKRRKKKKKKKKQKKRKKKENLQISRNNASPLTSVAQFLFTLTYAGTPLFLMPHSVSIIQSVFTGPGTVAFGSKNVPAGAGDNPTFAGAGELLL